MASVRKRRWTNKAGEQTAWIADYFDQTGVRRQETFDTEKAAKDWLVTAQYEVKKGVHTPPSTKTTVAEAGADWIAQAEADGLEYATVRQYRQHLNLHISPLLGRMKLAALTPASLRDFRNQLLQGSAKRSPRSRVMTTKVITSLGAILADAMEAGHVARNVVHEQPKRKARRHHGVEGRQKKRLVVGVDYPSIEELRTLLTVQGRWRPFLVTAIFTGLRASELRGLAWDAVDLDKAVLHVRQRADRRNVIGNPKSESARREVPLVPMVVNTLREWRLACPQGDLVFPTGHGTVQSLRSLYRSLQPVQCSLGLAKPYGLHALRHAAASLFIEHGFSPKRVQALMGHSTIQVTFDVYGHLFPAPDEQGELQRLQARLVG